MKIVKRFLNVCHVGMKPQLSEVAVIPEAKCPSFRKRSCPESQESGVMRVISHKIPDSKSHKAQAGYSTNFRNDGCSKTLNNKMLVKMAIILLTFSTIPNTYAAKGMVQLTGFADIVEPLMPAVVNIYTVKYNNKLRNKNRTIPELVPFEGIDSFFKEFNVPFMFDLYSNRASSLGSGFIIDETGLIVTNNHVVAGSDEIHVKLADNSEFPARVIGRDPRTDLALIKIEAEKPLPFVSFGNSSEARVGDVVIAIGNSLGFGGTVTTGIISSKSRDLGSGNDELIDDFIQTDAAINTGNSGGPLFNIEGKVIGINTSIPAVAGGTNVGIGFAIPSSRAQVIVEQLKKNGKITRGRLDIAIQEINKELAEAFNLKKDYGVLVVDAKIGGAGQKAGVKRGDVITEFNDKKVLNSRKLQLFVAEAKIGEEVKLTVMRGGEKVDLKAVISESKGDTINPETVSENPEKIDSTEFLEKSGVLFADLTEDLSSQFNIDRSAKGVMVAKVNASDIKPSLLIGDIVVAINQESVDNIKQFNNIYEKLKTDGKKSAILLVKRGDFSMFMVLPVR